ncbi:MAG: sulfatase-like hydrolase/transferase [Eubacteriales bacterium]|nr:sulfatase-like hydrolase/transferase [Eubacteriales bacterium]
MKQKNILLVFCDQLRSDMISSLGNTIIKTPALDRLVARGITFDNAYSPSPVCVAARHAMHTGVPTYISGCTDNMAMPYYPSFMEILSANGYQTHGIGKMHFTLKDNPRWGFEGLELSEEVNGAKNDAYRAMLYSNGYEHVKDLHGVRSEMYYVPQVSQVPERLHCNSWLTERSISFLENRDPSRPFFLMTSYIKPHPPFENPVPWNKLYRCSDMPDAFVPENSNDLICHVNRYQNAYKYRSQGTDRNLVRSMRAAYYGCVSFLDYTLGKIFDYLDETGLTEETLIVLTSDHGEMLGDYNCYGKRCFLEPASHIPLIVCDPSSQSVIHAATPVSLYDIFPTLLSYAGIKSESETYGANLLDIASKGHTERTVYGQFSQEGTGLYMARDLQYKYIFSAADNREWLFDISQEAETEKDTFHRLSETRDISDSHRNIADSMKDRLITHFRGLGIEAPFDGNDFRRYPVLTVDPYNDNLLLRQDPPSSLMADNR